MVERLKNPCNECLLNGRNRIKTIAGKNAKILVVTRSPTSDDAAVDTRHLDRNSKELFLEVAEKNGFKKSDFAFHSYIRCPYNPDNFTSKERKQIETKCREYLLRAIEKIKPEIIIPLGADAAKAVYGRAVKITKVRGKIDHLDQYNANVMPMFDPFYCVKYPQHIAVFNTDFRMLSNYMETGSVEDDSNTKVKYKFIDDLQFLIDQKPKYLSFDTETMGLRPHYSDKKILTMQFCVKPGEAFMLSWDHPDRPRSAREKTKLKAQLRKLLCNPNTKVLGHNVKYDQLWMRCKTGIKFPIGHDTLMLFALLDENTNDKSLNNLVKLNVPEMAGYDDAFNASVDKENLVNVPLPDLLNYGCGDADAALRLFFKLLPKVQKDKLLYSHYRHVSIPGLNAFVSMEYRGVLIDEVQLDSFEQSLAEEVEILEQELLAQVPRSIKRKHVEKGLKFSRKDFLLDILFYHKDGFRLRPVVFTKTTKNLDRNRQVPSTSSKDHLPFFFEECPFTVDLSEYIKYERMLNTNVRRFREKYIIDGRIYPKYSLTTAVTGRSASSDPNGQNFPVRGKQAKEYKKIFIAPDGYIIVAGDLSQAELRIAADMANELTMLRIYNNNQDIHIHTACIVMGVTLDRFLKLSEEERDLARFKAKAVNFGFIYGMGWRKFIIYAKTQYGVEFTEEEAMRIRDEFFRRYAGLLGWHNATRNAALRDQMVRSYSGRIRHLPMIDSVEESVQQEAVRMAINSPVQEFASSLGVMALGRIEKLYDPKYFAPVQFIHDAIYVCVPLKYAVWGAYTLKYMMESTPIEKWFGIKMKVPIVADIKMGLNASDTYEMKGLELDREYRFDWKQAKFRLPEQEIPPHQGRIRL